jgi:hypothetical protein
MTIYAPGTSGNTPAPAQSLAQIQAAAQPAAPAAPTISSLYGGESDSDKALDATTGVYATQANTPVDEAAIRAGVTSQLQSEIDATNQVYNQKLNEAQIAGANNVGSNTAINARSGLTGSDFGNATSQNVLSKNNDVYSGIGDERTAALAAITNAGNSEATAEIAAKNTAKQQSATDYINFLSQQDSRKTSRTQNAASQALAAGMDLTDPSSADVKSIASSYNIDPAALVSSFVSAKNSQNAATKANLVSAPITDNVYQPGAGGTLKQVQTGTATPDSNLKEYQYAVTNDGYTGSLADFLGQKANLKTSVGIQTNPLTGVQTQYDRTGPAVAGFSGSTPSTTNTSGGTANIPAATPTTPVTLPQGQGPTPIGSKTGEGSLSTASASTPSSPYVPASLPTPTSKVQLTYQKDFTSGKTATQINALNTAVGHLFDANGIFSTLNNGALQSGNSLANYLSTATGKAAAQNYGQAQDLVSSEISGAYGANAVSDRQAQGSFGSAIDSPAQHAGYVNTVATFLSSKIAANVQSYRTAMGANPPSLDIFISPANQVKLSAMGINVAGLVPGLTPSSYAQKLLGTAEINSKTGQVRITNPDGSKQLLQ